MTTRKDDASTSSHSRNTNNNNNMGRGRNFKSKNYVTKRKQTTPPSSKPKSRRNYFGNFDVAYTNRPRANLLAEHNEPYREEDHAPLSEEDKLLLVNWNLPSQIVWKYSTKGLTSFFPWQLQCLANERVLNGRNLVYSAPTSAGKTLVAEILMVKRVLELGKKAIMIVPFVAVAREKMYSLQDQFGDAGIRVEGFMNASNPPGGFKAVDIAICTIERANALINRLLEENELSQVGTIVVDELHLIGDSDRGYLLELLLTKIKYMVAKQIETIDTQDVHFPNHSDQNDKLNIQIIGLSATLPNLNVLATWLDAELITTEFRPVPLSERIKMDERIYDDTIYRAIRTVKTDSLKVTIPKDKDHIAYLSLETVLDGHSVLIFCRTKTDCEVTAGKISNAFKMIGNGISQRKFAKIAPKLRDELNTQQISAVLSQLKESSAGYDKALAASVSFGVAFHHAGLTMDERDIIEAAFKVGTIRVIVSTSTLSAGVNLPARRVIISEPRGWNKQMLDVRTYRQMCGRAGRKGIDSEGESILMCTKETREMARKLVRSRLTPVTSTLLGNDGQISSAMKRALLEAVASGIAKSRTDIEKYARCTLLSFTNTSDPTTSSDLPAEREKLILEQCLAFLEKNEFIRLKTYEDPDISDEYTTTKLGSACLASSLSPDKAIVICKELKKARQCFVLENDLHIVYQVTPLHLCDLWRDIDWHQFSTLYDKLTADERLVGQLVGVDQAFMVKGVKGLVSKNPRDSSKSAQEMEKLHIHQRFFTALALNDLVNEVPIAQVSQKYDVTKGQLQKLQQDTASFARMVTTFLNRLGWTNLELLLGQFQERLQFGVHRELCDLVKLSRLNGKLARVLFDADIKTVIDLAKADPTHVQNILHRASSFSSTVHGEPTETRTMWMPGKSGGMSEEEVASVIVQDARRFLQHELGLGEHIHFETRPPNREQSQSQNSNGAPVVTNLDSSQMNSVSLLPEILNDHAGVSPNQNISEASRKRPSPKLSNYRRNDNASDNDSAYDQDTCAYIDDDDESSSSSRKKRKTDPTKPSKENESIKSRRENDQQAMKSLMDDAANLSEDINTYEQSKKSAKRNPVPSTEEEEEELTPDELSFEGCKIILESKKDDTTTTATSTNKLGNGNVDDDSDTTDMEEDNDDEANRNVIPKLDKGVSFCGKDIRVQTSKFTDFLPRAMFESRQPIGIGVKIAQPMKQMSSSGGGRSGGIGSRILANLAKPKIHPSSQNCGGEEDAESYHSIALFSGGDSMYVFKWKALQEGQEEEFVSSSKTKVVRSKIHQLFQKICRSGCPIILLDAKEKLKQLLKVCGTSLLQHLPCDESTLNGFSGSRVWDPKVAQWLWRCDESTEDSKHGEAWIKTEDLVPKHFDEEEIKIWKSSSWSNEMRDSFAAWLLMDKLEPRLRDNELWNHFIEVEMPSIFPLLFMEWNGFGMNLIELERLKKILYFKQAVLCLKTYQLANCHFNLNSSDETWKVLFGEMRLPRPPNTKGVAKEVLVKVNHEIARMILEWRKVTGAINKVVVPFQEEVNFHTGRVHGIYSHFSMTGRAVMSEPSIQVIHGDFDLKIFFTNRQIESIKMSAKTKFGPKVDSLVKTIDKGLELLHECSSGGKNYEENISMRNVFGPSSEEYVLLSADYSQLELRVLAHLCGDENLLQALNSNNSDVFKAIAANWKKIPIEQVTDSVRKEAKAITYGIVYGMGSKSLAEQMNVDEVTAQQFSSDFKNAYPGINSFLEETIQSCRLDGYIETILGRRRYLPDINSQTANLKAKAERQAVNSRIQGSGADVSKKAMIEIQAELEEIYEMTAYPVDWFRSSSGTTIPRYCQKDFNLDDPGVDEKYENVPYFPILNLHDEFIYEVKKSELSTVARVVRRVMESAIKLNVELPVVVKVGRSWGTLSHLENF